MQGYIFFPQVAANALHSISPKIKNYLHVFEVHYLEKPALAWIFQNNCPYTEFYSQLLQFFHFSLYFFDGEKGFTFPQRYKTNTTQLLYTIAIKLTYIPIDYTRCSSKCGLIPAQEPFVHLLSGSVGEGRNGWPWSP